MISMAQPKLGFREIAAVRRVMISGQLAQGPQVEMFEREFSELLLDSRPVVAVNSGTSGLHLALKALGIGRGDEVIVPSFTFAATPNSVVLAGAKPVFCDIDYQSFNLDSSQLENLVSPQTRAVMPVHLFGKPAQMDVIKAFAMKHNLLVIEDAAQAHGASFMGSSVGTLGDAGVFSLYPTKNMTSGEGGMVSFAREGEARILRLLRNQGMQNKYEHEIVGFNARMSDIHAAIGRVQLTRLNRWTRKRQKNARYLLGQIQGFDLPVESALDEHVYNQFTIRVQDDRDGFARALEKEYGVKSAVYYSSPCHRMKPLRVFSGVADLPETDRAAKEVLSLPIHPRLGMREMKHIARSVNALGRAGV